MSDTALVVFVAAVVGGTALTRAALRWPSRSAALETLLGALLCTGLLLLGASLARLG